MKRFLCRWTTKETYAERICVPSTLHVLFLPLSSSWAFVFISFCHPIVPPSPHSSLLAPSPSHSPLCSHHTSRDHSHTYTWLARKFKFGSPGCWGAGGTGTGGSGPKHAHFPHFRRVGRSLICLWKLWDLLNVFEEFRTFGWWIRFWIRPEASGI